MSNKSEEKNGSILVILISLLFLIFGGLCLFLAIYTKTYILIASAVACLLVAVTMNVADRFKVNKHNSKVLTIISLVSDVIAIVLSFIFNIYSLVFSIPAFIFSKKVARLGKNKVALGTCIVSALLIAISIGRFVLSLL